MILVLFQAVNVSGSRLRSRKLTRPFRRLFFTSRVHVFPPVASSSYSTTEMQSASQTVVAND